MAATTVTATSAVHAVPPQQKLLSAGTTAAAATAAATIAAADLMKRQQSTDQTPAATSARVPSSREFSRRHFLGGALGGMTAAVVTSPLEIVKTRLQIQSGRESFGVKAPTTFGVMRSICRSESMFGLWRGITPTLMGVIPSRAIYFGSYSKFKQTLADHGLQGRVFNFLAAAGAGSLSATLVCPIWVVKTRVQLLPAHSELVTATRQNVLSLGFAQASGASAVATRPQFTSIRQVAIDMYRQEGPRAFFRGLAASYWGISESAIQFALYEECKDWMEEPSHAQLFLAAGLCKLIAAASTYPHEVVRTRMRDQRAPLGSKELKYRTMIQSIRTIFKEEGARGLYGGLPAHLLRVVPNAAIMFLVVEMVANQD